LKVAETDFLREHGNCWTARQAREFSIGNVHAMEIPAPAARIFPELGARDLLAHGPFWKLLLGIRVAIGKMFGWDKGLAVKEPQGLEAGKYFGWFHVIYVDAPREVGMTVENQLTRGLVAWVLAENSGGTTVFNVTCANFNGRRGRLYWQVIRPFHDGLIEDSLRALRQRVERR
jgi:Protein of unknown function (DUF2867)